MAPRLRCKAIQQVPGPQLLLDASAPALVYSCRLCDGSKKQELKRVLRQRSRAVTHLPRWLKKSANLKAENLRICGSSSASLELISRGRMNQIGRAEESAFRGKQNTTDIPAARS